MIEAICSAFLDVTAIENHSADAWVKPYKAPATNDLHQCIIFIKPETTALKEGVDLAAVLETVLNTLKKHDVTLGAIRVLNGNYLDEQRTMAEHYGVINNISTQGEAVLTPAAKEKLNELFGDEIYNGMPVQGAHQFLADHPEFNALSLCVINDNLGTTKLGGGSYALKLDILGAPTLILNPFHPYQLVPYTTPGNGIIVIEGQSTTPWNTLRGQLIGTTDPTIAAEGSIRQQFLANAKTLGLKSVNQGSNGIHLSAGPLEGMVELQRFMSSADNTLPLSETAFGSLLASKGLSDQQIQTLANNPMLDANGKNESAFDLTEEIDALASATTLSGAL